MGDVRLQPSIGQSFDGFAGLLLLGDVRVTREEVENDEEEEDCGRDEEEEEEGREVKAVSFSSAVMTTSSSSRGTSSSHMSSTNVHPITGSLEGTHELCTV